MAINQKVIEHLYSSLSTITPWVTSNIMLRIDITEDCDLHCQNCNKLCGVAKSQQILTLDQLDKFANEMISLNVDWPLIFITGGEPTIHPQFEQVLDKIDVFCKNWKKVFAMIITNKEEQPKEFLRDRVFYSTFHEVGISRKERKLYPILQAPIDYYDFGKENWQKGCFICDACGPSFSRYGWYICPLANSLDRVLGFDLGAKSFNDFTFMKKLQQRESFCKYCGYFFTNAKNDDLIMIDTNEVSISPTWQKKLEEYKVNPPKLTLY